MRAGNRFHAQRRYPVAELLGAGFQVTQPLPALGAVGNVDCLDGCGAVGHAQWVGVDVGIRLLTHRLDQFHAAGNKASVHSKCLAEGADNDIRLGGGKFRGAPPGRAVSPDAVRVVYHRDNPVVHLPPPGSAQPLDLIDRGIIAAHAEDSVEDHHDSLGRCRNFPEMLCQFFHLIVFVDRLVFPGNAGDAHGPDDAVVIQLIADPIGAGGVDGQGQGQVGGISGVEDLGRRLVDEAGDPRLQVDMIMIGAVDKAHRPRADPKSVSGLIRRCDQGRMVGQRQIAVGVHADEFLIRSLQFVARTPPIPRRNIIDNNPFRRLGAPFRLQRGNFLNQSLIEFFQ